MMKVVIHIIVTINDKMLKLENRRDKTQQYGSGGLCQPCRLKYTLMWQGAKANCYFRDD